jgi:hypothetical protein
MDLHSIKHEAIESGRRKDMAITGFLRTMLRGMSRNRSWHAMDPTQSQGYIMKTKTKRRKTIQTVQKATKRLPTPISRPTLKTPTRMPEKNQILSRRPLHSARSQTNNRPSRVKKLWFLQPNYLTFPCGFDSLDCSCINRQSWAIAGMISPLVTRPLQCTTLLSRTSTI